MLIDSVCRVSRAQYTITPPGKSAKAGLALKREWPKGGAHSGSILAALLAPNSKCIVTVGDDMEVKLWAPGGELIASVTNKQGEQYGAAISADSRYVAVAASAHKGSHATSRAVAPKHGQVSLYEIGYRGDGEAKEATGLTLAMSVAGHARGVNAVSFAQDCVHLATACKDGEWSIVATNKPPEPREYARGSAPHSEPFSLIALSPMAKRLVGATASTLTVLKIDKGKGTVVEVVPSTGHVGTTALSFSGDGLRCLSAGEEGRLRLWKVEESPMAGMV